MMFVGLHEGTETDFSERSRTRVRQASRKSACRAGGSSITVAVLSGHLRDEVEHAVEAECLAECDEAVARAQRQLVYAYMRADALAWPERVRVAVAALLAFLDEEPVLTEILFGESLEVYPLLAARRAQVLRSLALAILRDGSRAAGALKIPACSAEGMLGVCATVIKTHLMREDPRPLTALTGTLTGLIVMPRLGAVAALEQMEDEGVAGR
jgi:hypothetical protein